MRKYAVNHANATPKILSAAKEDGTYAEVEQYVKKNTKPKIDQEPTNLTPPPTSVLSSSSSSHSTEQKNNHILVPVYPLNHPPFELTESMSLELDEFNFPSNLASSGSLDELGNLPSTVVTENHNPLFDLDDLF